MQNKPEPIIDKEEVAENPDAKIDQDFKGFPHGTATDENIKPETNDEQATAATDVKDGEKIIIKPEQRNSLDEQESDGSGSAFDGK